MIKLNFGCGRRFTAGWVNIDFHSEDARVQRVNLLKRWPFRDNNFDVVYSSHTLEHFGLKTAEKLLGECRRVMKPGGIIRTVVPDLEQTCREYLRVLGEVDRSDLARRQYDWIILELLDQLARNEPTGLMEGYRAGLEASGDRQMLEYFTSRTDRNPWASGQLAPPAGGRGKVTLSKVLNKCIYTYVGAIKKLLPPSLRESIVDNTRIGEKHKWMYDRYGLKELLARCGFSEIVFPDAGSSRIPDFGKDCLDVDPDGTPYKPVSLYCEALRA